MNINFVPVSDPLCPARRPRSTDGTAAALAMRKTVCEAAGRSAAAGGAWPILDRGSRGSPIIVAYRKQGRREASHEFTQGTTPSACRRAGSKASGLKRDVFSKRGTAAGFRSDKGEVDAVLRRLDQVPWWVLRAWRAICFAPRAH